ncbi:MAG: NPCBM/NEW2 domain-containing protein [Thermogutta sp.]
MRSHHLLTLLLLFVACATALPADARDENPAAASTVGLGELDLSYISQGWGKPRADKNCVEKEISIAGRRFATGLGTHAVSVMHLELDGQVTSFSALVGVDDSAGGKGSVVFRVYGDGRILYDSGVVRGGEEAKALDVDLRGVRHLLLYVGSADDGIDFDHADWADARFAFEKRPPLPVAAPREEAVILTPPPPPKPLLNNAAVYGCRPGRPVLYRIPCTGNRPILFAVDGLPPSITLDAEAGILRGTAPDQPGEYVLDLHAKNEFGEDRGRLTVVVGDTLALTPPMGWNSWYIHYHRVSDADMRAAADAMIRSGMADFGYAYVNIDDCWMVKPDSQDPVLGGPPRDERGAVRPNGKFPDMKALTDYIHERGLKAGIYISPGPLTCAGYVGSYRHEEIDARKFAEWGFDFLKYDWCSYGRVAPTKTRDDFMRPYSLMGGILKRLDRDIVFNLCQYGMDNVWEWGAEVGGHCWRTTGDLGLEGGQLSRGIYQVGLKNATLWEYAGPGRWNDPDYLLIGWVGDARTLGEGHPTSLTPNEQYSHMSMWCLMAAPLIFSGDMTKLDDFTLNILCNREVLAVDQDPLGKQARIARRNEEELILVKPLADGSRAVGLFNLGEFPREIAVTWEELGLSRPQRVRNLWPQSDLGTFATGISDQVGRHGVVLVRLWDAAP